MKNGKSFTWVLWGGRWCPSITFESWKDSLRPLNQPLLYAEFQIKTSTTNYLLLMQWREPSLGDWFYFSTLLTIRKFFLTFNRILCFFWLKCIIQNHALLDIREQGLAFWLVPLQIFFYKINSHNFNFKDSFLYLDCGCSILWTQT